MTTAVLERTKTDIDDPELENITFEPWDPAEEIETKEVVIAVLDVAFEDNDPDFLISEMKDIVRSEGFLQIARELGLTREALCQAIAPAGVLSIESAVKLLDLLGFRLKVESKSA